MWVNLVIFFVSSMFLFNKKIKTSSSQKQNNCGPRSGPREHFFVQIGGKGPLYNLNPSGMGRPICNQNPVRTRIIHALSYNFCIGVEVNRHHLDSSCVYEALVAHIRKGKINAEAITIHNQVKD